ncbi:MAG: hypothetical protein HY909_13090 [Deltaproteobacteria bacterium]|nr:hypothetical protein [Deltaproteobacteria bacterium]
MFQRFLVLLVVASVTAWVVPARAVTVQPQHPRIFLNAAGRRGITPATLRRRCEAPETPYARACRASAPPLMAGFMPFRNAEQPLITLCMRYLLFADEDALGRVREQAGQLGSFADPGDLSFAITYSAPRVRQLAVAYDWLYDALSPSDRAMLEDMLLSYGDWMVTHEPPDVFDSVAYAHASMVALAGLALAGASADAGATPAQAAGRRYLDYAEARWKNVLLPALAYTRGWWHEGAGLLHQGAGRESLYWAAAWTTGTTEDAFLLARERGGDVFNQWARYEAYALRPDFRYSPFGDALDSALDAAGEVRPMLELLAWGTGNPVASALADEVTRRVPVAQDFTGPEAWHQLVFNDPLRPTRPDRTSLPLAWHFAPGAGDTVVLRSGWADDDTWVTLTCGDWFSAHQRIEAGGLQVFRRAPLVVSTGSFDNFETPHWLNWYSQRSIHASTLQVFSPEEVFPAVRMLPALNDGGQRSPYGPDGRRTLEEYRGNLTRGPNYDMAGVTAFEAARYHDYVACDLSRAYNSTAFSLGPNRPKVREVTRQLVFLRPNLLVLFDRVEATDPRFEKRFVLHGLARPLAVGSDAFAIQREGGRLTGRTLLPRDAQRAVLDGFRVNDLDVPPLSLGREARGSRLQVTARAPQARDYFLHVLSTADTATGRDTIPPHALLEDGDRVGVRVLDPSGEREYTVLFPRTGPTGGSVRVARGDGAELYRGLLGAGGRLYAPVSDGGVPDAGEAPPPADGGVVPRDPPGCGCTTQRSPTGRALLALLALTLGAGRRRGRAPR